MISRSSVFFIPLSTFIISLSLTGSAIASLGLTLIPQLGDKVIAAAQSGDLEALRSLRDRYADFSARSELHNATALHWVIVNCRAEKRKQCVKFLVNETNVDINGINGPGENVLCLAAKLNDWDTVGLLIAQDSINVSNDTGAQLLFHYLTTEREQLTIRSETEAKRRAIVREAQEKKKAAAIDIAKGKRDKKISELKREAQVTTQKPLDDIHRERREFCEIEMRQQKRELEDLEREANKNNYRFLSITQEERVKEENARKEYLAKQTEVEQKETEFKEKLEAKKAAQEAAIKAKTEQGTEEAVQYVTAVESEHNKLLQTLDTQLKAEDFLEKEACRKARDARLTLREANMLIQKGAPMLACSLRAIHDMSEEERVQLAAYSKEHELVDTARFTYSTEKLAQLLTSKLNRNAVSREGLSIKENAFWYAACGNKRKMLEMLVANGCRIQKIYSCDVPTDQKTQSQELLNLIEAYMNFYEAAGKGKYEEVARYIEKGFSPKACFSEGNTLLHAASASAHSMYSSELQSFIKTVTILLKAGVDPHALNEHEKTPLHVTSSKEIARLLASAMNRDEAAAIAKTLTNDKVKVAVFETLKIDAEGI